MKRHYTTSLLVLKYFPLLTSISEMAKFTDILYTPHDLLSISAAHVASISSVGLYCQLIVYKLSASFTFI